MGRPGDRDSLPPTTPATPPQIWRLTYNAFTESYESTLLGDMGEGVGPVALYDGQVFGAEPAALPQPEFSTETQTFAPMEALTTGPNPPRQTVPSRVPSLWQRRSRSPLIW